MGGQEMTKETINLIIEWFAHIEQLATDRKTQTGAVMDRRHCLDEIAAMASRCKQFVKEYRYEQEPIDEEKLENLAQKAESQQFQIAKQGYSLGQCIGIDFSAGYKVGYKQGWEDKK